MRAVAVAVAVPMTQYSVSIGFAAGIVQANFESGVPLIAPA